MTLKTVAVCSGQGLSVKVVAGQLVIDNGGVTKSYPRAGSGLERIIIIGRSGMVSLSALQWCSHVGIPIVVLRPDGEILSTSAYGPDGMETTDGRLIRAQAVAASTPVGMDICRNLLTTKISLSANVAETRLEDPTLADMLRNYVGELTNAGTVQQLRTIEGRAADAYFNGWKRLSARFCRADTAKIPERWSSFTRRQTQVRKGGTNRRASDPINAMLNYLYTVAATECRLACMALGLEPSLGFLHADQPNVDTLVWDLIETVRPIVDLWLLGLLEYHTFTAEDFEETRIGSCRIAEPLTHSLAATGPLWAAAVAPHAETVRNLIADSSPAKISKATRLTASRLRNANGHRAYSTVVRQSHLDAYPELHTCKSCAKIAA